jgi:hypothetical protein
MQNRIRARYRVKAHNLRAGDVVHNLYVAPNVPTCSRKIKSVVHDHMARLVYVQYVGMDDAVPYAFSNTYTITR